MPASYWEALLRLQKAEVAALRGRSSDLEAAAAGAREDLARVEAQLGPAHSSPAAGLRLHKHLLPQAITALDSGAALFSFQLGDSGSWLWAVDRGGVTLYSLPPRAIISAQVREANRAVRDDLPQATRASAALYSTLFGKLALRFQRKQRWLIALDDSLFAAPLATLVTHQGKRPVYLVESHVTQVIPGIAWWLEAANRKSPALAPLFVGIGDPVYNAADPRLRTAEKRVSPMQLQAAGLVLPRLAASGPELDACARAWNGESTLLKGTDASRRNLEEQLRRSPAVVHFATHFLESFGHPADGVIALSMTRSGDSQILPPEEIADWRIRAGLIVLSGCQSAGGDVRPGTGLLGLVRAWLAAGADDVVASRWPVPDENSALFGALYRNFARSGSPVPRKPCAMRSWKCCAPAIGVPIHAIGAPTLLWESKEWNERAATVGN